MSKKTDHRAAEREARKLAFQQLRHSQTAVATPAPIDEPAAAEPLIESMPEASHPPAISEAQLAANRANAQFSSGPTSEAGRAKSAQHSLKHGLTSKTIILPGEDHEAYQNQLNSYIEHHAPSTDEELRLLQSMVASLWRLNRIQTLESAIYIKGQIEFANKYEDQPAAIRKALKYEKSIRNLNIQEARLNRMYDKDRAELQRLQITRKRDERIASEAAAKAHQTVESSKNGFDFSNRSVKSHPVPSRAPQPHAQPQAHAQNV
jgi:hypothetical protein